MNGETGGDRGFWASECDRLTVQLQESERLRQEAIASCDMMREELAAVTRERNEWRAGAASQQEQATHLRQQVAKLQAIIQRLQNLQPEQVTPAELQAVNAEVPESVFIGSPRIAAVCRGMLREVGGDG